MVTIPLADSFLKVTTIRKHEHFPTSLNSLENMIKFGLDLVYNKDEMRASLVAQWLRLCLPMQGTQIRALVWEDPTCRGATRPVSHNY